MTIPMNGYEKASNERDEDTLFPDLDPSDGVKIDVWREYHLNRFWSAYTDEDGNSCPSCRSSSYVEEERQLDVEGLDTRTVLVWYRCEKCDTRWQNDDSARFKYGT